MEPLDGLAQRLEALEVKASYADDLLDELNLTVYRQQQQIDALRQQLALLRRQLPDADAAVLSGADPRSEVPPHY